MLAFDEAHIIGVAKVMPDASRGVVAGYARDCRRSSRADPAANNKSAGITSLQKHDIRGHRYGGGIRPGPAPPSVGLRPAIPQKGGRHNATCQAGCLGSIARHLVT